ncbi:hypothetical protein [Sphingosinicella sp. BN140058]|uniref:hypothetical protein n=1 Tax=Sphingosinicella sp. BN140058 TaxID=1892855 RepID=UPI0010118C5A|nr:hypothetical protein [Sphingosinicella sp. BN140058]QAY78741.1 hypothetical protein ETR14_21005 [Sphingosinicella sp. BN140058]
MNGALGALAAFAEASGFGPWARSSPAVYPLANIVHLLGLSMLVGGIGILDLRIIGLWRTLPLPALARALTPVAIAGLLLLAASGTILFAADGRALATSFMFRLKLLLIATALANAVLFRWSWRDLAAAPSWPMRLLATASLLLWLAVGSAGRMIAYS